MRVRTTFLLVLGSDYRARSVSIPDYWCWGPKTDLTKGDRGTGLGPAAARAQSGQGRYLSDKLGPGPPALHSLASAARHNGWTIY